MSPANPLNPASGEVPIPEDQREIDAALRAGRISHRFFPYVAWRFGERGRKFTKSDSAWLAWLTRHEQERVYEQICWLRSVLSNRGMPSWILQTHLRVLCRQLTKAIPEHAAKYRSLDTTADQLQQARKEHIAPARCQRLVSRFVDIVDQGPHTLITGTGKLLVAAVADERLGIVNAVNSLVPWLTDVPQLRKLPALRSALSRRERALLNSKQFLQAWKMAIDDTIASGRKGEAS